MMEDLRVTLGVLLEADVGAADRDAVAGLLRRSRELRSWLDSFDVRCVRRTSELAGQGRSEPAESMGTDHGLSAGRAGWAGCAPKRATCSCCSSVP